jgi:DNA-binding NarL/FixJ family response regulator
VLREAGYLVYEASDGEQAVDLASTVRPRLVIMDVLMPGMSGIEATERIRARDPEVRVLALSAADSPETVRAALRAGAISYLTKTIASRDSLLDAVRRTVAGEAVISPDVVTGALLHEDVERPLSGAAHLTLREREIVALVAQGMTNTEIAELLALSRRTIENHLARIFRTLGINSRSQLVRIAADQRIDRYPWSGQNCTVLLTDIVGFGSPRRDDTDRLIVRNAMYNLLRAAFDKSGMPLSAIHYVDRGDG